MSEKQSNSQKIGTVSPEIRSGLVDLDSVRLTRRPVLGQSEILVSSAEKLQASQEIVEQCQSGESLPLDKRLTLVLDNLLDGGKVDGIMIATGDGLVVAESSSVNRSEILAAICSASLETALRVEREGVVSQVEEISIRGGNGEYLAIRTFSKVGLRYFLIAYMKKRCPYRRLTNLALRDCGELLAEHHGK